MKIVKKIIKIWLSILAIPIVYLLFALVISTLTVNKNTDQGPELKTIYLTTNGVHLDIILPKAQIQPDLLQDLNYTPLDQYFAFGWGDENFYLHTPTWADMTLKNATQAMLLKSSSLVHLTRYQAFSDSWVPIQVSEESLGKLNAYINATFNKNEAGQKRILANQGYGLHDDFYKANGSYSCFFTCNTWVNNGFKKSGLKACVWTPYDFSLLNKYR